jgi:hypothetical protein
VISDTVRLPIFFAVEKAEFGVAAAVALTGAIPSDKMHVSNISFFISTPLINEN